MTWHRIQHRLEETFFLCVLVSPLAFVLATAIGLASWVWAGSDFGFFAAGFSWILAMTVFPAWLRVTWGPDTRIICQHCIASGNASLSQRSRIERRREGRSQVDGRGTFFKGREETFAVVSDLSKRGCRVKAASDLSIGECGKC